MDDETLPSNEIYTGQTETWALEFRLGIAVRSVLLGVAGLMVWLAPTGERVAWLIGLVIYLGLAVVITALLRVSRRRIPAGTAPIYLGVLLDLTFTTWLIYMDGGLGSSLFLLYQLLLFKAVLLYPRLPGGIFLNLLFAPLYVVALYISAGSFYFLRTREFLVAYGLLFALTVLGIYLAWSLREQQRGISRLYDILGSKSLDLERKTAILQQTAADLSEKVVELRSLQEGIRAINSALALDEVLRLIAENASQVLGGASCYVALVERDARRPTLATIAPAGPNTLALSDRHWLETVATWIIRRGESLAIENLARDGRFAVSDSHLPLALIGAPLLVDGQPIGALMATSRRPFEADQSGLLTAFADQAAAAVKNARLYRDLALEKRRTEEKSSELEAIVRGIGDGVIVTDREKRLLLINPRAAHIFGLTERPAANRPLAEVIHNADLAQLLDETLRSANGVAVREVALPPIRDRQPIYQGLAATIVDAAGEVSGIVSVLRDVTGQKELERMKSNFLSVISHELKTPLHSIKGFVDIILMGKTGPINDIQRDFLNTVKEQTTQLQRLINDLLEFSRLESGQIKLHPQEVGLAALAEEVIEKLSPLAAEGGVHLISILPADFPVIEADRVRLEQVFSNLMDNAIKFTPAGGKVTVSGEDLGEMVRLRVTDTGIGIPEEERERIFDRFYQVDSGSTRSYRGTGLGLTICKHIIEQHQGRIWAEGAADGGAVFVFELPKKLSRREELALDFSTFA